MINGRSKAWALGLLVGVLLLGAVAGAAVDRVLLRDAAVTQTRERRDGDRDRRTRYIDWLTAELGLTEQQRAQVDAIVERNREQVAALWQETRPRYEELQSHLRQEIREILNDEQRAKYQELLEKQAAERRRRSEEDGRP
jgi:Spy/CpxP family protein refolding chaperone